MKFFSVPKSGFFRQLLLTTIVACFMTLIVLCALLIPALLSSASKNDLSHEANLARSSKAALDTVFSSVDAAMEEFEQSGWLHQLYISHVLNGRPISPGTHSDILSDLSLFVARRDVLAHFTFQFYDESNALYTNHALVQNLNFYQEQFPGFLYYRFFPLADQASGLTAIFFQGNDHLVWRGTFTDVIGGFPKGEVNIFLNTKALIAQLEEAAGSDVQSFRILDKSGSLIWEYRRSGGSSDLFYTTVAASNADYQYSIGVPRTVHYQTRTKVLSITAIGVLFDLLVCLVLSIYFSRKNYTPVDVLSGKLLNHDERSQNEMDSLNNAVDRIVEGWTSDSITLDQLRPLARQRVIDGLLSGYALLDDDFSIDQLRFCELSFQYPLFTVLSLRVIELQPAQESAGTEDLSSSELSAEPFLEAVLAFLNSSESLIAYLHVIDDRQYRILINSDSAETVDQYVSRFTEAYPSLAAAHGVHIKLSIGIGNIVDALKLIYRSSEEAVTASTFGALNHIDEVTFFKDISSYVDNGYYFPFSIEQLLSRSVSDGCADNTLSILKDVIEANRQRPYLIHTSFHFLYMDLFSTVMRSARTLGVIVDDSTYAESMNSVRDLDKIESDISALIADVCTHISDLRTNTSSNIEISILNYIESNLYDPQLSLASVADRFQKSTAYISTMFKQKKGINFSDYVNQSRISRAVELISKDKIRIDEVYRTVGYISPSTFRRNFIKYTKSNPSSYSNRDR